MATSLHDDLIAAVATPPGQGGIGVIRLSGNGAADVARIICNQNLVPRHATYCKFSDGDEVLDEGIAIAFAHSASFTGEEVVELQGHGGPVVLQRLLDLVCRHGARLARPGEFSERAFLNGKLDLAQSEAIADLISSSSVAAARAAVRSLQGDFSRQVHHVTEHLAKLRVLVEACIDFPDEDVEFLQTGQVASRLQQGIDQLQQLRSDSVQGQLLNEGASVALLGVPNAGKSSLLNVLSGEEAAIVTDIPGTTRDLLKVDLLLDGLPLRLVDTAGLRDSGDKVEQLGVARAKTQAQQADLLLIVVDATAVAAADLDSYVSGLLDGIGVERDQLPTIVVFNKIDLLPALNVGISSEFTVVPVSALLGTGLEDLRGIIKSSLGFNQSESGFIARARHVAALELALGHLIEAKQLIDLGEATEIAAEEMRFAHNALGEIVGTVTPDDLLGRIFSEFCIGK
ncbi:MAG: tRNA uridine-5-carboxymethylaminomethyl(34) synthesis GTPase MnmE [Pseudomonadaceae bacterium]|nr:tRNA uridine-5-carboxymethylaminomethyl(34) synthesis GTPase MnmE [Pseudomonadaceae bacterium]